MPIRHGKPEPQSIGPAHRPSCTTIPRAPQALRTKPCTRDTMALQLNDTAPDFEADTTSGHIRFHDWMDGKWTVLFSHPMDFTPVCTTERGRLAKIAHEGGQRGVKLVELSGDRVAEHSGCAADNRDPAGN